MTELPPYSHPYRVADLAARKPTRFALAPDAETRARIAAELGLIGLDALVLKGELRPLGRSDWRLDAEMTATVVQACIVSLAPVTTKLRETVARTYLAEMPEPEGEEVEMPADDTIEALPRIIDVGMVATEALDLALPLYPRAPDAALGGAQITEPGKAPMTDEETRPFAGLAELLARQKKD